MKSFRENLLKSPLPDVHVLECKQLHEIQREWKQLWDRCNQSATPFQFPEWVISWWKHFGRGELRVLTFRNPQSGELVGVAPFYVVHAETYQGNSRIALVGEGISDYLDVLVDADYSASVELAITSYLENELKPFDVAEFQELQPDSTLLAFTFDSPLLQRQIFSQSVCPLVKLNRSEETIAKRMKELQKKCRKYNIQGTHNLIERSEDLFENFLRLHRLRWSTQDRNSAFADDERNADVFRDSLGGLEKAGLLRIFELQVEGKAIASLLGFLHLGKFYSYLNGWDPQFASWSPGNLVIEYALSEMQCETLDFLRGAEKHKFKWGEVELLPNRRVVISKI